METELRSHDTGDSQSFHLLFFTEFLVSVSRTPGTQSHSSACPRLGKSGGQKAWTHGNTGLHMYVSCWEVPRRALRFYSDSPLCLYAASLTSDAVVLRCSHGCRVVRSPSWCNVELGQAELWPLCTGWQCVSLPRAVTWKLLKCQFCPLCSASSWVSVHRWTII